MKLTTTLALASTSISAVLAAPFPQHYNVLPKPKPTSQLNELFYLAVNAAQEPYHKRHLVILPESQTLGCENFTIHPETPPILFTPTKLASGLFALRGESSSGDPAETPYMAARVPNAGSNDTIALMFVNAPDPSQEAIQMEPEACPEGYTCVADQWTVDGVLGFGAADRGKFEPTKNAPEGWPVYWKGNGEGSPVDHPVFLNVVANAGRY